jgi:transposase-like protein
MEHVWMLINWPNGTFPRYKCKNCNSDVIEENSKFRYFNDRSNGPSDDCDFELIKQIMKL